MVALRSGTACLILVAWAQPPACAQAWRWDAALGAANDLVERGVSHSRSEAVLFADIGGRNDQAWAIGAGLAWVAGAGAAPLAQWRLSLSKGSQPNDDWSWRAGATLYRYPRLGARPAYAQDELWASGAWKGRLHASVGWLPALKEQSTGVLARGSAFVAEGLWRERLAGRWSIDAGLGWHWGHGAGRPNRRFAGFGTGYAIGPVMIHAAAVRSWVSSADAPRRPMRWVASVAARL